MIYLDTSAVVKLVVPEAETQALQEWLKARTTMPCFSSHLLRIELLRSVARAAPERLERAREILMGITMIRIDEVVSTAAELAPPSLRTLDAIHLATARKLEHELHAFVAYDRRLVAAAGALGIHVVSPASIP